MSDIGRSVLEIEARALLAASDRLQSRLPEAVQLIVNAGGKLILTGIGKSGHLARHLAALLVSTGTPAVFLHPVEALHGDLGIVAPGDPVVLISKSGATEELLRLVSSLHELKSPLIGILGDPGSHLAAQVDIVLDASVEREADWFDMLPTASSMVALAIGHALAVALMEARGVGRARLYRLHPAGQL